VSSPISPSYSAAELTRQLKAVKCKALFTCATLLSTALAAASAAGIPKTHVYLMEIPEKALKGAIIPTDIKSVNQLIAEGKTLSPLPELKWAQGQGARQTAFLCSSSGTSGLPVSMCSIDGQFAIMITDRGVSEKCHDLAQKHYRQHSTDEHI
jgi:acyl-CoA synthetase (AMP-forming)/AMP-acid ligase II